MLAEQGVDDLDFIRQDCGGGGFLLRGERQRPGAPACLEAIARTHPAGLDHEIPWKSLDNASDDGSADAVAARFPKVRLIAREPHGLAENNTLLLREELRAASVLLNEDSDLGRRRASAARRARCRPAGSSRHPARGPGRVPSRGGFPGPGTALSQALFLHRWLVTGADSEATARGRLGPVVHDARAA